MPITVAPDFRGAQWTKLVINGINAVPAVTGLSVQAVIAEPVLRRIVTRAMQETVRTGLARGVTFGRLGGLTHRRLRLFASLPLPFAERLPVSLARNMGQVPNPGSTLQSIRRNRLTEVDHLNGAVSALAPGAGQDARVNAALVQLVHGVEASGRHISPRSSPGSCRADPRPGPSAGERLGAARPQQLSAKTRRGRSGSVTSTIMVAARRGLTCRM